MSNNSDMIKMLRLVEGQQFAGLPEQRPGDQVRGTEKAAKNGGQHPFHNRLVGEEISLEDKLSKKYQDMKDLHGKDKDVAEGSGPREKAHSKYVNRNSPESQSKIQAARDRAAKDAAAEPGKKLDDRIKQKNVAEGNMPQSVIKSKQKYADMTAQEFHAAHKNKSAEELQAMAWRHGYGKGSNHYVDKHKKGQQGVAEGQEEIEYICSGCSGSGEGPHEGTTCRTCHGSGVEMGYADEPEHDHDEEELDEDQHESPMERPMLHRIMMRHMDLIEKYGIDRVLDAVRDVADSIHIGPDDEIGTSDVSAAMVNVMNELKSQTLDEYGSLPGTSAEPVAGTTAPSSGASTPSSTPADEPASGGSPNNTTLSSPAAAGVSAGGSSPTTPSAGGAAKPGAPAAPQPNVPDVPITPDEKSALDRIRANAGLKTQFDNLLKQVQPKVQ